MIWILFAVLTIVVVTIMLIPLLRPVRPETAGSADLVVYRDQLAELERDQQAGLILGPDADAARNEVQRRLLAANQAAENTAQSPAPRHSARLTTILLLLGLPLMSFGIYYKTGTPNMPDIPLAWRIENAVPNNDVVAMVAKAEKHLQQHPEDRAGWLVLAPIYKSINKLDQAAAAYRKALQLSSDDPAVLANFGETLVQINKGKVEDEAKVLFEKALSLQKAMPKAEFYLAIADYQAGNGPAAQARLKALLATSPANAPWRPAIERQLAMMQNPAANAPGPNEADIAAAANMSADERQQMITTMVTRLEARLNDNGDDLEGWLKLLRAKVVLADIPAAKAALVKAEAHFSDNTEALEKLSMLARQLKLK